MTMDSIYLEVGGRRFEHFLSYSVEADLYVSDHAFSLEIGRPEFDITPGQQCKLYVNDTLEMTGIVERSLRRCDKSGRKMTVEGRDLMGLLVDSYVEEFFTVENMLLSDLTRRLLKNIPFINRKNIYYQKDLKAKVRTRKAGRDGYSLEALFDSGERVAQIRPGMTVFQVLSMAALSTGQMFYGLPDGSFVFGRPMTGGVADYDLVFNEAGIGNNLISAEVEDNISKRWSKVTVIGQRQAHPDDGLDIAPVNVGGPTATVSDATFPFYKPFVQVANNDSQTPKAHARLVLEKMRHDGRRLVYELPRHSNGRDNYTVNRLARVQDDIHGVDGVWLVSGRTYKLNRENGKTTQLRLSPPGLVEDGGALKGKR